MKPILVFTVTLCLFFVASIHPPTTHAELQYFGYYNVNGLPRDSHDFIPEIGARKNSNVAHIWPNPYEMSRVATYLTELRQNKMQAIINVDSIFRYPNWEDTWKILKDTIKGQEDVVYAFYFDEPVWTGVSLTDFQVYTKRIKADYPSKAIMAVEAYPVFSLNTAPVGYFDYVTDLGMDYYYTYGNNTWDSYLYFYGLFVNSSHASGKKLWLIPDGYHNSSDRLGEALTSYYNLAKANPQVNGLLVFGNPGDNTPVYLTILEQINPNSPYYNSNTAQIHQTIGSSIIAGHLPTFNPPTPSPSPTLHPSPSAKPGDLDGDGHVGISDYNRLITGYGTSYTIVDYNNLIANFGQ